MSESSLNRENTYSYKSYLKEICQIVFTAILTAINFKSGQLLLSENGAAVITNQTNPYAKSRQLLQFGTTITNQRYYKLQVNVHNNVKSTRFVIVTSKLLLVQSQLTISNRNTWKRCEVCSNFTIKTPERPQWHPSDVFTVNYEQISNLFLWFLLLTLDT